MEHKNLACMDEEYRLEITCPKDGSGDLIIAVSISRTYIFTNQPVTAGGNGTQAKDIQASKALVI